MSPVACRLSSPPVACRLSPVACTARLSCLQIFFRFELGVNVRQEQKKTRDFSQIKSHFQGGTFTINKHIFRGTFTINKHIFRGTFTINKHIFRGTFAINKHIFRGTFPNRETTYLPVEHFRSPDFDEILKDRRFRVASSDGAVAKPSCTLSCVSRIAEPPVGRDYA